MKLCNIEGCNKEHRAKGYCKSHYDKFKKYGDPLFKKELDRNDGERNYPSKRKPRVPYESNHKLINNIEHKLCSVCEEWLPMTSEHYYKNKSNGVDGFNTWCKKCAKEKAEIWRKDPKNREAFLNSKKRRNRHPDHKKELKIANAKRREKGYYKEYYLYNQDKFINYRFNHMHKEHSMTDFEWLECKKYFNNCCAYCGIQESDAKIEYNQNLHREHAVNNGENDITNCIPACKKCNSEKWMRDYDEWYTEDNPVFTYDRLIKIINWLEQDCYNIQEIN